MVNSKGEGFGLAGGMPERARGADSEAGLKVSKGCSESLLDQV
jgi:hypothetical protein